ncbi:MAG: acetyl-CoA carboxylase, carboxyltransferase subunit beta [Lachnospiraceae bacterium]|nr:acetyl-CoA carboxylase, carboxyltransferase subunit beta [Lachnospiraceae bacterium]
MTLENIYRERKDSGKSLRRLRKEADQNNRTCPSCGGVFRRGQLLKNMKLCPDCGHYFPMNPKERIALVCDRDSFRELYPDLESSDPLAFPGYREKLEINRKKTGQMDAFTAGVAAIGGISVALGILNGEFLMGSMGTAAGEKIALLADYAREKQLPLVIFSASGGARMQEGLFSLMQMAKTAAAVEAYKQSGGLFLSFMTDPTSGGVTASYASLGDVILAEPGALICFAGPRVIEQTIQEKLPEGFQCAEFLLEHGMIDKIVPRDRQRRTLHRILQLHGYPKQIKGKHAVHAENKGHCEEHAENKGNYAVRAENKANYAEHAENKENKAAYTEKYRKQIVYTEIEKNEPDDRPSASTGFDFDDTKHSVAQPAEKMPHQLSSYEKVRLARSKERPTIRETVEELFDGFVELHGDRLFRDDPAIMGGIGTFRGIPVTVIGHRKGKTTRKQIRCNFGMASPEGYRKARRLMEQAEKFHRPVICLIDTPGAYPGMEAESNGQANAIAESIAYMSRMKTPCIALVTGEGSSGGALAIGVADQVWMLEHAVYSILSPEGFASILWKDPSRAAEASDLMKLTAEDLLEAGLIDGVIPEGEGLFGRVKQMLEQQLETLQKQDPAILAANRYQKFRRMAQPLYDGDRRSGRPI